MLRLPFLLLLLVPVAAAAHPLPNLRFDRAVHVRLSADAVAVAYTLELNEWSMVLDGKNLVGPADLRDRPGALGFARVYAAKKAPLVADALRAALDGEGLAFRVEAADVEVEADHARIKFRFRCGWSPAPGGPHRFEFEDQNFEDRSGAVALTLDGEGIDLSAVADPGDLRGKSPLDLTPAEAARLRQASATFGLTSRGVHPPGPLPPPPAVNRGDEPPRSSDPRPGPSIPSPAFGGLAGLFDSGYGLGMLLLLAFGFGAAHAFTPGHGKTLVAAYLVGERGTVRHAVVLGLTTTLAHTGSVILVAAVLRAYYGDTIPAATEAVLKLLGGSLIFGVGLWLFLRRAGGRADHVHLFHDHHRVARQGEGEKRRQGDEETKRSSLPVSSSPPLLVSSWLRVIALGVGGGLVPCWDAVLLLLVAASAGRLGAAVPLLLAFSTGLAAVLVGLGVGVVYAHRAGGRSFGDARWFRALPAVSAALLVGLGVWFIRDGAAALLARP